MKKILSNWFVFLIFLLTLIPINSSCEMEWHDTKSTYIREQKAWTSLYYIDVDTAKPLWNIIFNLDVLEHDFIDEIASAENLNVLVLQDKIRGPAVLYYIDGQHNKIILEELGEVNMGNPQTLIDSINYTKENFPANRYQLCFSGHANAWYGVCPDDTSRGDSLNPHELKQAFMETSGIDLLCFIGCCKMGSLEVIYELKDYCDVYIASEDDGYGPHWYGMIDDMCDLINSNPDLPTVKIGEQIIKFIKNNPNEYRNELTISAIRTDKINGLFKSFNELCKYLYNNDALYQNVKSARNITKEFTFIQDSYLIDFYDFIEKYLAIETNSTVLQILNSIKKNFSQTIIAECHGQNQNGSHGFSIFYSTNDMISLYPTYNLDFTDDSYWDELLDDHKEKFNGFFTSKNVFKSFSLHNIEFTYRG
ncbi:MAG: clostripain-related cysteine peptidase [Candidatus Thermoplasmatota archaeon]|nr:clostripain-related cysteine peptidase [Candidatus Thermoplasmatota archaeon]